MEKTNTRRKLTNGQKDKIIVVVLAIAVLLFTLAAQHYMPHRTMRF